MIIIKMIFLFTHFIQAGGSIGVGSGIIPLSKNIAIDAPPELFENNNGIILDRETQEPLLAIENVSAQDVNSIKDQCDEVTLGKVEALKWQIPALIQNNSWFICSKSMECSQILAIGSPEIAHQLLDQLIYISE